VGEKVLNTRCSSVRVVVEPTLSGVKRCRRGKAVLRLTTTGIADLVMAIACGLHHLRVSCRHPLPAFDLMSFWSDA
jgi:hypothetical protein